MAEMWPIEPQSEGQGAWQAWKTGVVVPKTVAGSRLEPGLSLASCAPAPPRPGLYIMILSFVPGLNDNFPQLWGLGHISHVVAIGDGISTALLPRVKPSWQRVQGTF